jgi:hypothetical protein
VLPDGVNDRGMVLLFLRRKPFALVKNYLLLFGSPFPFSGFRNRRDKFRAAAALDNLLRRLTLIVEFPVSRWVFVRRVQDRMFEEWIGHLNVVSSPLVPKNSEPRACFSL